MGVASRVGRRQHGGVSLEQRRRDVGAPLRQRSRARSPEDGHGPHRHRGGTERSVDRVRDQRDEDRGRAVALGRRRRPLAHGEPRSEHQLPSVLLRRHSRRPTESQSRVLALRLVVHVGRRRPELPHDRPRRARRPSGDVDRPDEPQVHPERVGRRVAGELRRRKEFRSREQLSVHAVLPHQLRHAAAVHGVRRTTGQRQLVRREPGAVGPGYSKERLVHRVGRRRVLHGAGDGQAVARLLGRAGRDDQHHRHAHRHAENDLSVPEPRRLSGRRDDQPQVSVQLELADRAVADQPEGRLLRRQRAVQVHRLRHVVAGHLAGSLDERSRRSRRAPAARSSSTTRRPSSTARSSRSRRRRSTRTSSGSARTTATSRSRATAARRGATSSPTSPGSSRTRGSRRSMRRTPTPARRTSRPITIRTTTTRRTRS